MFDSIGAFTKQFTPVDGGYLYYPSRRSGGKLVSAEEFERLVFDWQQIAGRSGRWKLIGFVILTMVLWTFISQVLALPEWADRVIIFGVVIVISGRLMWASFAARRLVRDRDAIAPPRPSSQAGREVRALVTWPFIAFAGAISAVIFFSTLSVPERTPSGWAWVIGSGLILGSYLWIGFQKLRDRQR